MRCTNPRPVGFKADGKTISWSKKEYSKEFATFQLPCGKCIECRLEYARQWAIRAVHESKMHPQNSFITLTYNDENLRSPKLQYRDFQLFVMRLRSKIRAEARKSIGKLNWSLLDQEQKKEIYNNAKIGIFVTGEYGDKTKRPHWHAIIFNWRPADLKYKYSNERGDRVYTSDQLTELWGHGHAEIGSVTFESAGYCARYAAKKLIHGHDGHDYEPISKKSSHQAIGKSFIEKFWPDVFNYGYIILPDGSQCSIPRYYEKWFKKNKPSEWERYVTRTKQEKMSAAALRAASELELLNKINLKRYATFRRAQISRHAARAKITKSKFKMLQSKLKL